MNTQEKEQIVQELSTRFSNSPAAFVVHYQGCTCEELTGLRNDLRPSGAKFAVVKNTLAKRAVEGTHAAKLADVFDGPTAVIWSGKDPVTPAKLLSNFTKAKESFSVKAGVFEGNVLDAAGVQSLATLPSKEELIAKLLGLFNAPAIQLLRMLNAPAASLVRVLDAWRAELEKKEK
jgi:large subunit ribosomal protein L10